MFWKKKEKEKRAIEITDSNFNDAVAASDLPVLIDMWAAWCGPCKVLGPIIEELASEFEGKVVIGKVNVDQNPGLNSYFKIKSIPTLLFIKNGQLVERLSGLVPKPNLEEMLNDLIVLEVPGAPPISNEEE